MLDDSWLVCLDDMSWLMFIVLRRSSGDGDESEQSNELQERKFSDLKGLEMLLILTLNAILMGLNY